MQGDLCQLIPDNIKLPALYDQEHKADTLFYLRFYNPLISVQEWYLAELNPDDGLAFGYVNLGYGGELGYFDVHELQSIRLPFSLTIIRDDNFSPTTLTEVKKKEVNW